MRLDSFIEASLWDFLLCLRLRYGFSSSDELSFSEEIPSSDKLSVLSYLLLLALSFLALDFLLFLLFL